MRYAGILSDFLSIFTVALGAPNGHQIGVFLEEIATYLATEIYFILVYFYLLGHSLSSPPFERLRDTDVMCAECEVEIFSNTILTFGNF